MGYTHYWYIPAAIPQDYWDAWCEDVRTILNNLPDRVKDNYTYTSQPNPLRVAYEHDMPDVPPQVDATTVQFNGTGRSDSPLEYPEGYYERYKDFLATEQAYDLGHETFIITRVCDPSDPFDRPREDGRRFGFCKTAQKPYDLAVTACLIRLGARMAEGVEIASDGTPDEWEPARQLCEDLFGFAAVPLRNESAA